MDAAKEVSRIMVEDCTQIGCGLAPGFRRTLEAASAWLSGDSPARYSVPVAVGGCQLQFGFGHRFGAVYIINFRIIHSFVWLRWGVVSGM
jgi:hypothetical protein